MTDQPRGLTPQQVDVLLQPIMGGRVKRQDGQSYLPQQDVRAHLTRIFGFGGWSSHVVETALVHQAPTLSTMAKGPLAGKRDPDRIDCLWRATVGLDIRDQHGNHLATYEDSATGDAQNSVPLAAHDLALKSAVSTALKRAATCLGDQFGLSLYNKGDQSAFVRQTLIGATAEPHDLMAGKVPEATEEQDPDVRPATEPPAEPDPVEDPEKVAERAVTRAHQRRQERNVARTGPDQTQAKGRLWDALTDTMPEAPMSDRTNALNAECERRGWNLPAQLHTDRLLELAAYYEEKADDDIRARIARGE